MKDEGGTRRSHRGLSEVLELESSSMRHEIDLKDPVVDEVFRVRKERFRNNTRAGRVTRCDSRVPDGEADDVGDEKPYGSPLLTCESSGGAAAKGVHG